MISASSRMSRYIYLPLIFLLSFVVICTVYIQRSSKEDLAQFENHASIIADDIWAMNEVGAQAYLQLALEADHFRYIHVTIPGDESFLKIDSTPLTGLSKLLFNISLITTKTLTQPILHGDQIIGHLTGEKYVRVFFPLLNILVVMLFTLLVLAFIGYQAASKRYLAEVVEERTTNLRESERRFHDLVNLLPEMVLETNLNGLILYANKAANDRLGLKDNDTMNIRFLDLIIPADRERAEVEFNRSLTGQTSTLLEFTAIDHNNNTFPVLIRLAAIINDFKVGGARMVAVDMTQKKEMEEQLHRDQKMKAIGLMAGGVAHDLNNILSGVISYPEFLLLDLDPESKIRKPLEEIRSSGLEAAEVVSDLLTVARGIATNTEVIDLNEIIKSYLKSPDFKEMADSHPLVIATTALSPERLFIDCSPIHIRKCLMNLIVNGIEAINGAGTVTIASQIYDGAQVISHKSNNVTAAQNKQPEAGKFAKITVSDSGIGIEPKEIEHIFEPFYTKKVLGRSGTGLGLTVVWNTIQDHGGTITVSSHEGGTTFELFLPLTSNKKEVINQQETERLFKGEGETILVVDDELRQRDIAEKLIKKLGYSVHTVSSGELAVNYIRENKADLLILDMIMTPGQSGKITFEQILKINPNQKAIIASGFAQDDDVKKTLKMGAKHFISKPYTLEQLGATIYKTLHP